MDGGYLQRENLFGRVLDKNSWFLITLYKVIENYICYKLIAGTGRF